MKEEVIREVAWRAPPVACATWPVIVSCMCPSRSRDCISHEALVKAPNSSVRSLDWTPAAIRAGRIASGT